MRKILFEFKPDIFITEQFPFGREEEEHELVPLIEEIRKELPDIKIISSVGYGIISTNMYKIGRFLDFYDKILIHTPSMELKYIKDFLDEKNREWYEDFYDEYKERISFTGYIAPESIPGGDGDKKLVVRLAGLQRV